MAANSKMAATAAIFQEGGHLVDYMGKLYHVAGADPGFFAGGGQRRPPTGGLVGVLPQTIVGF